MQKTYRKKKQSTFILCLMLAVTIALSAAGCNGKKGKEPPAAPAAEQQTETRPETQSGTQAGDHVWGEGETQFDFTVVDQNGEETEFEIHTDKETVGEALLELGLIEGEEGDYGLFVKTVNGITADYDKDGVYWAFYVNGEYAQAGVDSTEITEGDSYAFKVE